jgi:CheY-like chemotaxis protein
MKTILIVDDDPLIVMVLGRKLTDKNYKVITANSGQQGLDLYFRDLPDLIILDWHMPPQNGDWFLQQLHADKRGQSVAVAIFSSDTSPEVIEPALQNQAVRILPKNLLSVDEIAAKIDEIFTEKPAAA